MANDLADAALMNVRLENGRTVQEELRKLDTLARMLDSQFSVMGMRFGIDSVLGLVPVAGDVATGLAGTYSLFTAIRLKLHPLAIAHIGWNLLFDTVIGAIPLVGDVFDFFFKSNTKNFKVIEKHLTRKAKRHLARGKAPV
ncbi:DUF4112 domain-containing protein [Hyphomonas sp.]|uniref:DUF4112 domain-containing protein n=1 Tax=Hyphomonas sp. TaxID=87 RepID=UPI003F714DD7